MVTAEVQMHFAEPAVSQKDDPLIRWRDLFCTFLHHRPIPVNLTYLRKKNIFGQLLLLRPDLHV